MRAANHYICVIVAVVALIDYIEIKAHHWMGFFVFYVIKIFHPYKSKEMFYKHEDQIVNTENITNILVFKSECSVKITLVGKEDALFINFGSQAKLDDFLHTLLNIK